MIARSSRTLFIGCTIAQLLAGATAAHAASDWQVTKVGSRDYLTMDNVAKFYSLPENVEPVGKKLRLDNGRNQIEVMLDSRQSIINGVRNWLSFPVVGKDGKFLISRVDLVKTIEPQFRPHMIANLGRIQTVVLDPGHGGHDKGARSPFGCEKDYTLDVARQLKPLLEAKGLKVILTRDSDVFVPLEVRAQIANATRDSIFVSIHFNATDTNPAAAGFEIYSLTPRGAPSTQDNALALHFFNMQAGSPVDAPSLALSTSVYHSVVGHFSEFDRGMKRARFAVLRLTRLPAILVEGGFLTERGESRLIANSMWRAKLAQTISIGIENYKALVEKKQRPMLVADYHRRLEGQLVARDATKPPPESFATASIAPVSNSEIQYTTGVRLGDAGTNEPPQVSAARLAAPPGEFTEQSGEAESSAMVASTTSEPEPENLPPTPAADSPPNATAPTDANGAQTSVVDPATAQPVQNVASKTADKPTSSPTPKQRWWQFGPFPHFEP